MRFGNDNLMANLSPSKHFSHYAAIKYPWLEKFKRENRLITGKAYYWIKRFSDILFVLFSLLVIIPLGILCAFLIKLESPKAPVFYKQFRTGRGGNRFVMYKFRTMVIGAEEIIQELSEVNEDGELIGPLKIENDPRVTNVGRTLRKLSLDEIPQVINVIKGDMSLVGPRPTSWGIKSYELWQTERFDVLPGITGLWQICARGESNFDEWLRWDILYLNRRSLMFDFEILMRTGMAVLKQRGAH